MCSSDLGGGLENSFIVAGKDPLSINGENIARLIFVKNSGSNGSIEITSDFASRPNLSHKETRGVWISFSSEFRAEGKEEGDRK